MDKFTEYVIEALSSDTFEDKLILSVLCYGLFLAGKSFIRR